MKFNKLELGTLVTVAALTATLALVGVYAGGRGVGENAIRQEAVQAGAAHYTVDPQTGETRFEWIVK